MNEKNSKLDLLIVGHAIEDTVFKKYQQPQTSWGGIYNVVNQYSGLAFNRTDTEWAVEPAAFGRAHIIIDKDNSSKDVTAELNLKSRTPKYRDAYWTHLMYSNELDFNMWGDIEKQEGIKSTDLCAGKSPKRLDIFDYVFLSDDEHNPIILSAFYSKTVFIAHNPDSVSIFKGGEKLFEYQTENKLVKVNPLGAGDAFAASFIFYQLHIDSLDNDAVKFAMKKTREYLLYN